MSGSLSNPPPPGASALPDGSRRRGRDLVGIAGMEAKELCAVLADARSFIPLAEGDGPKRLGLLHGRTVMCLFNEPSTRTRTSFEIAAKRLAADTIVFSLDGDSSASKGESLRDTLRNLDAMGIDAFVVRDRSERLPERMIDWVRGRVVNAGDGRNEHPTQALLDVLTVVEAFDRPLDGPTTLAGLRVAICGDVDHGRVAHSDVLAFRALGARVSVAGPEPLLASDTAARWGVELHRSLEDALEQTDVIVMLRIQRERLDVELPMSDERYHAGWGLSADRMNRAGNRAIVLHPGPMNRGIEIADEVADGPQSRILRQVTLGVAVRMAVLARACGVRVDEQARRIDQGGSR